jgi:hypothetical protein
MNRLRLTALLLIAAACNAHAQKLSCTVHFTLRALGESAVFTCKDVASAATAVPRSSPADKTPAGPPSPRA